MPAYRVVWEDRFHAEPCRDNVLEAGSPSEAWTKAVRRCLAFERVRSVDRLDAHSATPLAKSTQAGEN